MPTSVRLSLTLPITPSNLPDHAFTTMFFTPRFLKQAKLLDKGVTRFLDYKRDILPVERLNEINLLHGEFKEAMRQRDAKRLESLSSSLNRACERALPNLRHSDWVENIEVFFVSIVIAVGIRTYIVQPFQIPTSSMQPTLNGIIAHATEEDPTPGLLGKIGSFFTATTYINVVSDRDGVLRRQQPVTEHKFFIFRPYSKIHFQDGHSITVKCPVDKLVNDLRFAERINGTLVEGQPYTTPDNRTNYSISSGGQTIRKGQLLARGWVRSGDHVVVNKFAYHFRQPTRGEVFVFTTKNISYIEDESRFDKQWGSQHYIKRLTGVPGDSLVPSPPRLLINGQPATEPGIRRVAEQAEPRTVENDGLVYHGYSFDPIRMIRPPYVLPTSPRREYFAMGDNSYSSSDSRYFGHVPEQNLVGPGWFCYWPLGKNWGLIR